MELIPHRQLKVEAESEMHQLMMLVHFTAVSYLIILGLFLSSSPFQLHKYIVAYAISVYLDVGISPIRCRNCLKNE